MAYTRTQWNRIQQSLPTEDRMTYEEYLESLNAQSDEGNTARIATRDANAAELAALNEQANAAVAEAQRLEAEADASAPKPTKKFTNGILIDGETGAPFNGVHTDGKTYENGKVVETKETVEIEPDPTPVEKIFGPSQFSKDGRELEFKPITEGARLAIFGLNPATGKAYTDAESAALNGGYLPEGYKNLKGYRFDPVTGALEVLGGNGTTSGLGTGYTMNAKGNILPNQSRLPQGVGIDENGKYYQPGQVMPGESLEAYIQRMATIGPGQLSYKGKFYQYNARGMFYESGGQEPPDFVDTEENASNTGYIQRYNPNIKGNTTGPVAGKTVLKTTKNANGTTTYLYTDGTSSTGTGTGTGTGSGSSTNNPFAPGSDAAKAWNERKSAYDLLYTEFNKYGLGTLIEPLKNLVQEGVSPSEFAIQLRNTPQYQKRFAANAKRVQNGLAALNEAQYIGLEDQYQNIMRNYGLPEQYYARGELGVQAGFEQFIGNDVSPVELEDRIQTAERRVRFANPEVGIALRTFYPDITNGDILAYALDPKTALESLKRRITAAEVGSTAVAMGLATNVTDAEYLARYGVTKAQAQQGYQTISGFLPRAQQLSEIYSTQGVNPYTQATAEKEVFGVPGAAEATRQRKKIVDIETAAFSGSAGAAGGALARERAGGF